jgi:hypothetical protein
MASTSRLAPGRPAHCRHVRQRRRRHRREVPAGPGAMVVETRRDPTRGSPDPPPGLGRADLPPRLRPPRRCPRRVLGPAPALPLRPRLADGTVVRPLPHPRTPAISSCQSGRMANPAPACPRRTALPRNHPLPACPTGHRPASVSGGHGVQRRTPRPAAFRHSTVTGETAFGDEPDTSLTLAMRPTVTADAPRQDRPHRRVHDQKLGTEAVSLVTECDCRSAAAAPDPICAAIGPLMPMS